MTDKTTWNFPATVYIVCPTKRTVVIEEIFTKTFLDPPYSFATGAMKILDKMHPRAKTPITSIPLK